MRMAPLNLHTSYNNFNSIAFEGRKPGTRRGGKAKQPPEIKVMQFKRDPDAPNPIYQNGLEDGYDMGYEDGKQDAKFIGKAGMLALAALSALNLYATHYSIENSNANKSELSYKIAESNYDLNQRLDELEFNDNLNHKAAIMYLTNIMMQLEELEEKQTTLKEKIDALPNDSEESQALKEELNRLEEEYSILEEKYRDYMSEFKENKIEENNRQTPIQHNEGTFHLNA